jgi:photosystem II stability/assembly factor-like uncharacterized protein
MRVYQHYFIYCLAVITVGLLFCKGATAQTLPWQEVRTPTSATTANIYVIAPTSTGLFISGLGVDVSISNDNATTWKTLPFLSDYKQLFVTQILESNRLILFVGPFSLGVCSKDSVMLAAPRLVPLPTSSSFETQYMPKEIAIKDSLVLLSTAIGFYQSLDGGKTFSRAGTSASVYLDFYSISRIIIDNKNVWISSQKGIVTSVIDKEDWQLRGAQNESGYLLGVQKNRVFAYQGSFPSRYFRSLDTGNTWQQILDPVQSVDSSIPREFIIYKNDVFLATDGGIYRSRDDGSTWQNISYNLPKGPINTMAFDTATKTLYVAMYKGKLYRTDATTVGMREEQASAAFLSTLAPNPATDFTDISFTLPGAIHKHTSRSTPHSAQKYGAATVVYFLPASNAYGLTHVAWLRVCIRTALRWAGCGAWGELLWCGSVSLKRERMNYHS